MSSVDTLKQAAQVLRYAADRLDFVRDEYRKLADALEAMAAQKPVAWRYTTGRGTYRYRGPSETFAQEYKILKPFPPYAAPIATPEHEAQVRNAALEEAAEYLENTGPAGPLATVIRDLAAGVRDLKTAGVDHAA